MQGLCFRCEFRALFLEEGHAPRCECGDITCNKHACYMFKPVMPVITTKLEGDNRQRFAGAMISARECFSRVTTRDDIQLNCKATPDGIFLYWEPKDVKTSLVRKKTKTKNSAKPTKRTRI